MLMLKSMQIYTGKPTKALRQDKKNCKTVTKLAIFFDTYRHLSSWKHEIGRFFVDAMLFNVLKYIFSIDTLYARKSKIRPPHDDFHCFLRAGKFREKVLKFLLHLTYLSNYKALIKLL